MNKRNKKILLINPAKKTRGSVFWLPLGIAYIAAIIKKEGFDVKVIDAEVLGWMAEKVVQEVKKISPDIIGITAMTPQINEAWDIARYSKELLPNSVIILGGVHPSLMPEESLRNPDIDFVIVGEGEYAFRDLAKAMDENKSIDNIAGVFLKKENVILRNSSAALVPNLDELPYPERDIFPFPHAYRPSYYRQSPCATILTSRGCPGRCYFCNIHTVFQNRFRTRSPENVVDEIELLNKKYGIKEIHISDDNLTSDKKRVLAICDLIINKKIKISWACSNGIRVDTVNQELLNRMKQAGCYRVAFGIESGSQKIIDIIDKKITTQRIKEAVKMAKKAGLVTVGFFMVGNYGENDVTINETIKFFRSLDLDYGQFAIATPYPGTKLYNLVKNEGRFLVKEWEEFDLYTGAVFEWNDLPKEKIDKYHRKVYRAFYFRPTYIFKRIIKFKIQDLRFLLSGARMIFNALRLKPL